MNNKKINAYYDSASKRIVIDDDNVQKGDYIDVANGSIADQIFKTQLTEEVKNKVILEYKETAEFKNIIDKYKNNIGSLNEENKLLSEQLKIINTKLEEQAKMIETEKDNAVLKFKDSDEYRNLLKDNADLKKDINVAKDNAVKDFKLSPEFTNLSSLLLKQEEQIKYLPKQAIDEFKNSPEYKELEDKANRRSRLNNSKLIGEELENFCQNEYNDKLQLSNNTNWAKTTVAIQGKKPDFIFTVYTDDKKDVEIASIVLEMKTAGANYSNNKIDQYLDTLEFNRLNFNAEFALLVTDLELDPENDFILKKASGKSRIFIVRPHYFAYVLILFKLIYEKSSEFATFLKKGSVGKEQILNFIEEFKKFKEDLFTKSIKNIQSNLVDIVNNANKIKATADNILNSVATITDRHLKATENKINDYLKKIVNKEDTFKEEN